MALLEIGQELFPCAYDDAFGVILEGTLVVDSKEGKDQSLYHTSDMHIQYLLALFSASSSFFGSRLTKI